MAFIDYNQIEETERKFPEQFLPVLRASDRLVEAEMLIARLESIAPVSAVTPIRGWKVKQIAR